MTKRARTFDDLHARDRDPWGTESSHYEAAKFARTLAALPRPRFRRALDVGCSVGVLTRRLAQRCDHVLAVDVSEVALSAARRRCAGQHVSFRRGEVPEDFPEGRFDLVVLSEILYFLSPAEVARTRGRVMRAIRPGGSVVLVNFLGPCDLALCGEEAADLFCAGLAARFAEARTARPGGYRIDVLTAAR